MFGDGSTSLDYGAGYVDALAARNLLAGGGVADSITSAPIVLPSVELNIEKSSALRVREGSVLQPASNLKPGQRFQIFYRVVEKTSQVTVTLSNFVAALPPASQNQLFGDDTILTVHSAKTSQIGQGDYLVYEFTHGGTFTINNPEPGVMRITLSGSWTNAGAVSADIAVVSAYDTVNEHTAQGKIRPGQLIAMPLTIPAGTSKAEFRLEWRGDWASYPSNDLDLILVRPNNTLIFGAATLNSPETLTITNPAPGVWTMLVHGFEVNTKDDEYQLRVVLDGKVVH